MAESSSRYGITWQGTVPFTYKTEPPPPQAILDEWMRANVVLLQALSTLEAPQQEIELDHGAPKDHVIQRLESKLDLTISLLAILLRQQITIPDTVPITLMADSIEWESTTLLDPDTQVNLSIYLNPRLPQPLMMPAVITVINPENKKIRAKFTKMNDECQDWLERTLFRFHRRSIQNRQR